MAFPPQRDHAISLAEAAALTRSHRTAAGAKAERGGMFHRDQVVKLLEQAGCAGLRIYHGRNADGTSAMVLVGVEKDGKDMTAGTVLERHFPCPPYCDEPSQLNQ
jgi:uncharacterized lipoprotein NlpE involved in copper resistance